MIINYNFDDQGFFTGLSEARLDPVATKHYGTDCYLLPRNATHSAMPETVLAENQQWQWDGKQWIVYTEPEPEDDNEEVE